MKSYMAKGETVERSWYVVDAQDMVLGRLSSQVAAILRGKKLDQKKYIHHTGYPGGIREISYRALLATKPEFAVYESIRRMMPKGPLGDQMLKKLRIYAGPEHKNAAQQPQPLTLK